MARTHRRSSPVPNFNTYEHTYEHTNLRRDVGELWLCGLGQEGVGLHRLLKASKRGGHNLKLPSSVADWITLGLKQNNRKCRIVSCVFCQSFLTTPMLGPVYTHTHTHTHKHTHTLTLTHSHNDAHMRLLTPLANTNANANQIKRETCRAFNFSSYIPLFTFSPSAYNHSWEMRRR